jgi:integrase
LEYAYKDWAEFEGFEYKPRHYYREESLPFVPLEEDLDQLIAGMNKNYAPLLQLLKETGMRCGEAVRLLPIDFDFARQTVTLNRPEKRSRPRQFKISTKLTLMITPLVIRSNQNAPLWNINIKHIRKTFERCRKRMAEKLGNNNIARIQLKTSRHWKATMEYHRTKDILHVMRILGHKNIKNTLVYTHLVDFESSDEFICRVANNTDEASTLVEAGFDFVAQFEGKLLFKKRK